MNPIPKPGEEWTWDHRFNGWSEGTRWFCDHVENDRVWWNMNEGLKWTRLEEVVDGQNGWKPVLRSPLADGECV